MDCGTEVWAAWWFTASKAAFEATRSAASRAWRCQALPVRPWGIHIVTAAGAQVVQHRHLVPGLDVGVGHMRTDEPGPAGNQYFHWRSLSYVLRGECARDVFSRSRARGEQIIMAPFIREDQAGQPLRPRCFQSVTAHWGANYYGPVHPQIRLRQPLRPAMFFSRYAGPHAPLPQANYIWPRSRR